jgi:hypothetical protein
MHYSDNYTYSMNTGIISYVQYSNVFDSKYKIEILWMQNKT